MVSETIADLADRLAATARSELARRGLTEWLGDTLARAAADEAMRRTLAVLEAGRGETAYRAMIKERPR